MAENLLELDEIYDENMSNEEVLNICLSEINESCPELLPLLPLFSDMAEYYIDATYDLLGKDEEDSDDDILKKIRNEDVENKIKYDDMDIRVTIDLVRKFLNSIDLNYLKKFDESLINGTFDIHLEEDDFIEHMEGPAITPKPNPIISIPVQYTSADGAAIIHEFFHFLNDTEDLVGVREIFTEMLSIYYELRYYQFISDLGYSSVNFYKETYERIDTSYNSATILSYVAALLDIQNSTGKITEENIEFIDSFRKIYTERIEELIDIYENRDEEVNVVENVMSFMEFLSYVLGTIVAFKALKEPQLYDIKMKYLNDNINYLNLEYVLETLDIKLSDYPELIEECANDLMEAKGVIYGKNNSNSGTYGGRKN